MRLAEISLAWLGYFLLHSLLAASGVKAWMARRWPRLMPGYRMVYNATAVVFLLPVLWLVYGAPSPWLWQWMGAWAWVANGAALTAVLGFLATARAYDMGEFLGLRQLEERTGDVTQTFSVSTFHRFVRHPWYSISLVLIWTRDMNGPLLISALAITAYLVIGSRLEEKKLIESYGDTYRRYMAAVPGLIPLPWKTLSVEEAAALAGQAESQSE